MGREKRKPAMSMAMNHIVVRKNITMSPVGTR